MQHMRNNNDMSKLHWIATIKQAVEQEAKQKSKAMNERAIIIARRSS